MTFTPLRGSRVTLRALTQDDAADLAERRSDPETAQFQAWPVPYPIERARALIDEVTANGGATPGGWYQAAIVDSSTGAILGDVAAYVLPHGHTAEIGYTLHRWARGKGFATEAAALLIDHLVDDHGMHRIEASTHPDNVASNRVLERLGFTLEGIKRESYWVEDEVTDDAIWGLLARDWRTNRPAMGLS